jgi:hypothetical protein
MRAGLIALVALVALPAFAQATLVVVEKEPLQKRLGSVNEKLSEAIGKVAKKDKKLAELLKAARAELTDAQDQVAGAPESEVAKEGQRAAINMTGDMMGFIREQAEADRRERREERREEQAQPVRQEVVVVHRYEGAPPPAQPAKPTVQAISDAALRELMEAIDNEGFPDGKMAVLEQAAPSQHFVVAQVQQLLELYPFPKDRLGAMRVLKPRLLDPQNGFKLYGSFPFENDKQELKRILAQ